MYVLVIKNEDTREVKTTSKSRQASREYFVWSNKLTKKNLELIITYKKQQKSQNTHNPKKTHLNSSFTQWK